MIFLKSKNQQAGYIALISVIIISLLLITMGAVISFGGFFTRFSILENEYKEISRALTEACADMAILKLSENWNYSGEENLTVDLGNCQIFPVQDIGGQKLIRAQAIYQNSYTNLEIVVSKDANSKINVESWKEVPKF